MGRKGQKTKVCICVKGVVVVTGARGRRWWDHMAYARGKVSAQEAVHMRMLGRGDRFGDCDLVGGFGHAWAQRC